MLVRDNKSLNPKVTVEVAGNTVIVDTPDGIVLKVHKENERLVKVQQINLRPFGINIHGNESSLTVMTNSLSGNVFIGSKVMVGISGKKMPNKISSRACLSRCASHTNRTSTTRDHSKKAGREPRK